MITTAAHANGHARPAALAPLRLPAHGPVSGWPQRDDPGQSRTPQDGSRPAAVRLRAAWDAHRQKVLYGIAAAVLLSTAASFYESFTGLMGWFGRLGFHGVRAVAAPAMVDLVGLAGEAIALVVIIEGRPGKMVRFLAWSAFSWGLVLSVVGNAGRDGFRPGPGGWFDMAWFAVPPLSLAIITSAALALAKLLLKPAAADVSEMPPDGAADKRAAVPVDSPRVKMDSHVDKRAGKTAAADTGRRPAGRGQRRTALDKAAAAIRDNPGVTDKAALARIAGVSAKSVQRVMNGTAKA